MTYMASCGDVICDKLNSTDVQWFKIDQVGKKSDGKTWVQANIMNGGSFIITLLDNLTPGDYLIRHEISDLPVLHSVFHNDDIPCGALSNLVGTFDGTGVAITCASTLPFVSGATSTKRDGHEDPVWLLHVTTGSSKSRCKLKKRAVAEDAVVFPRHISRVMARVPVPAALVRVLGLSTEH
ncbi:uncharacterized protein BXZ73DRAFT_104904 [Epithele typhae]|uniref:uncharacterized protein n=1 Tax=Epithele typhae TaxID=378194 RepID=UPI0020083623|nr:uncharacterized protein BXZ73DRAFT_104904 [Epithele typhae]KAH9919795.1 hypothetical protein BXZ73DRAFT_104904 [Epithele typhae]